MCDGAVFQENQGNQHEGIVVSLWKHTLPTVRENIQQIAKTSTHLKAIIEQVEYLAVRAGAAGVTRKTLPAVFQEIGEDRAAVLHAVLALAHLQRTQAYEQRTYMSLS